MLTKFKQCLWIANIGYTIFQEMVFYHPLSSVLSPHCYRYLFGSDAAQFTGDFHCIFYALHCGWVFCIFLCCCGGVSWRWHIFNTFPLCLRTGANLFTVGRSHIPCLRIHHFRANFPFPPFICASWSNSFHSTQNGFPLVPKKRPFQNEFLNSARNNFFN